jgi:bifunctional DNA-binding transcriptional regulator/antitoxin component of YhaV-PrlF toxin-antitoxin module
MGERVRISRGGQISLPAAIRRRWATENLLLVDQGDAVILSPLPADPVSAAIKSLRLPAGLTTDELRARSRAEDARTAKARTSKSTRAPA